MTEFFRTWAEIDLDALDGNMRAIKKRLQGKKITAVVKANAYGHGAVCIARAIADYVDFFAVATLDEAIELRRSGCGGNILILSPIPDAQLAVAAENDIAVMVFSVRTANILADASRKSKKKAKAFLCVDTGMGRIGVCADEAGIIEAKAICAEKDVEICGIITHYACADSDDKTATEKQMRSFDEFIAELKNEGITFPIISASNTAAAIDLEEKYDMARVGIAIYGMYPSEQVKKENIPVKPILSLKTKISHIKTVPAGTPISYGHTLVTDKPTRVATLSAGYADGVPIALSGKGRVLIAGKSAKILGRVCMDQMMVDISDIDGVTAGDTATIIGRDGDEFISAEEVASLAGTINYDIACRLDFRVPRVYLRGGKIAEVFSYIGNGIY